LNLRKQQNLKRQQRRRSDLDMKGREIFKVEDGKIVRLRRHCPRCGEGVFMAEHKDRVSCGKCGYTEFKTTKKE